MIAQICFLMTYIFDYVFLKIFNCLFLKGALGKEKKEIRIKSVFKSV